MLNKKLAALLAGAITITTIALPINSVNAEPNTENVPVLPTATVENAVNEAAVRTAQTFTTAIKTGETPTQAQETTAEQFLTNTLDITPTFTYMNTSGSYSAAISYFPNSPWIAVSMTPGIPTGQTTPAPGYTYCININLNKLIKGNYTPKSLSPAIYGYVISASTPQCQPLNPVTSANKVRQALTKSATTIQKTYTKNLQNGKTPKQAFKILQKTINTTLGENTPEFVWEGENLFYSATSSYNNTKKISISYTPPDYPIANSEWDMAPIPGYAYCITLDLTKNKTTKPQQGHIDAGNHCAPYQPTPYTLSEPPTTPTNPSIPVPTS